MLGEMPPYSDARGTQQVPDLKAYQATLESTRPINGVTKRFPEGSRSAATSPKALGAVPHVLRCKAELGHLLRVCRLLKSLLSPLQRLQALRTLRSITDCVRGDA